LIISRLDYDYDLVMELKVFGEKLKTEFPSVNVYRDKFTEIGKNAFLEISREKREKLLAVGFEIFSIEISNLVRLKFMIMSFVNLVKNYN
jgi:hypothetical protein